MYRKLGKIWTCSFCDKTDRQTDTLIAILGTPTAEKVDTTSAESGFMNEKTPGFSLTGFWIMMLMPRLMNGLLKSMTRSRADVIVNGAIARSAFCIHKTVIRPLYRPIGVSRHFQLRTGGSHRIQACGKIYMGLGKQRHRIAKGHERGGVWEWDDPGSWRWDVGRGLCHGTMEQTFEGQWQALPLLVQSWRDTCPCLPPTKLPPQSDALLHWLRWLKACIRLPELDGT